MIESIKNDFNRVWSKPNNAVAQIILINVIAFIITSLMYLFGYENIQREWFGLPAYIPKVFSRVWTLVTYMFVHQDFWHIFWNMVWFYWFGKIIQEFLGSKKVIGLFVTGALMGALWHLLGVNALPLFTDQDVMNSNLIGASGGVAAVMVGAAVFMPNYTFYLLFLGPVKIKYIALVYMFLWIMGMGGYNAGGELAHLGGACMGWIFAVQIRKGHDLGTWVIKILEFFQTLFKPQPKIRISHKPKQKETRRSPRTHTSPIDTSQEEIDAILDKISQHGYESLSKDEKQKLFNASK